MLRRLLSSASPLRGVLACVRSAVTICPTSGARIYSSDHPSILPVLETYPSLHKFMIEKFVEQQDRVAMIDGVTHKTITYSELLDKLRYFAGVLYHKYNVRPKSTLLLVSLNSTDYPIIIQGVLACGAVVSMANPFSTPEMLAAQCIASGANVVLAGRGFARASEAAAAMVSAKTGVKTLVFVFDAEPTEPLLQKGSLVPDNVSNTILNDIHANDTVFLPFSSGTMGNPKGVELSNRNMVANILQSVGSLEVVQDDRVLAVLPMFHIYGLQILAHSFFSVGATEVVMPVFDMVQFVEHLSRYKITQVYVAPPIIVGLLKYPLTKKTDLSALQSITNGAAPLSPEVESMFRKVYPNITIRQGFGLTETSPVTHVSAKGSHPGSIGTLVADTEMRIIKVGGEHQSGLDGPGTMDAEEGDTGELWIRGPQVMKGYLNNAEETARTLLPDGWLRTGDIVRVGKGTEQVYVVDRLKELIKYKGFQVPPAELEGIILTHPLVDDCVVVGVPDWRNISFEVPRAQVVLKTSCTAEEIRQAPEAIMQYVADQVLWYKKLYGGVRVVKTIPKSNAGKLLRRHARAEETQYVKMHQNNWF